MAATGQPQARSSPAARTSIAPAFLRPIAHRGLHDRAQGRIENTAPAFLAAIDKGYGIECDLQAAEDGTPMVFHDEKLDRLVAASAARSRPIGRPASRRLRYKGQDEHILTFAEFLELVDGRVPLLVEVKAQRAGRRPPRSSRRSRGPRAPIAARSR